MALLYAAHLPLAPGDVGSTVLLTGPGAAWTAGSPGSPTFAVSGGSGAAITGQRVDDATHATLTLTTGTAEGLLTITDPSTGATATVQVKARVRWCPPRRARR